MYSEGYGAEEILQRMKGGIISSIDKSEGSFIHDSLSPVSKEIAKVHVKLEEVKSKFDIETLFGEELHKRVYQSTGIKRKQATYAHKYLTVIGNGAIKSGNLFQTAGGIQFKAMEDQVIKDTGNIKIEAVIPGASGNVPANQITKMPILIQGVVTVTNPEPTEGGYDSESDEDLLKRYYERMQSPPTSGNIAYFKKLALDFIGVADVRIFPTWNGTNTVKIVFIDSNRQPPSSELVDSLQNYMDPGIKGLGYGAAPFGAFTTVLGAKGKAIDISFNAIKDDNYTDAQREEELSKKIKGYFKDIAFKESTVSIAKIGALILSTSGFLDYNNLKINGVDSNILLNQDEVPIKGGITIV